MSIPWNLVKDTTGFINERVLRPTADLTAAQRTYFRNNWMRLQAALHPALHPVISPNGTAKPHDPAKWAAQNVLGEGGFGIASLWRYNDPGHKYDNLQVVLKTGKGIAAERDMEKEGKIMNLLSDRNEEHLLSMVYVDKDFTKLYLEYCPEGDLNSLMRKLNSQRKRATEEQVWRVLLCLTKAASAMHRYAPTSVIHYGRNHFSVFRIK